MDYPYGSERIRIRDNLPVVPLRDIIVFPFMIYPLIVGRSFSMDALQAAMISDKQILLVAQKQKEVENPTAKDLYRIGTVVRVQQVMKLANGTMKILVEGICRAWIKKLEYKDSHFVAHLQVAMDKEREEPVKLEALARSVSNGFTDYVKLNRRIPDEVLGYIANIEKPGKLADIIAAHLQVSIDLKQTVLEALQVSDRLSRLAKVISSETEILKLEQEIDSGVRESLSQSQREFYLQHQLKVIKEELGQSEEGSDISEYEQRIAKANLPDEVRSKANEEVNRLSKMHGYSAEANVVRNYLDWLLVLPWNVVTEDRSNFREVENILDSEHYGLEKPKKRIAEHLAVMKLTGNVKGPILCFVGPPGVGKTSLGKSIAHALDRKFARMSLGGMKDEAEIRGHRRTYIGAMPGRIIQMLKKANSSNPVFLLDEVDKIGSDFHGDPASALLEVLDPEQNSTFQDHYLECEFDLSKILFITTANTTAGIPPPLLDRTEIIDLPGYLEFEKVRIAEQFLKPKQKMECGLVDRRINLSNTVIEAIIQGYTRESGVREMERKIGSIFRQIAQKIALGKSKQSFTIRKSDLKKYLGISKYHQLNAGTPKAGKAIGLAWTQSGGEILPVETLLTVGEGELLLTGKLGDVLQESARAALTYLKSQANKLKIDVKKFKKYDLHLHFPEGAVPKDGPSAGVAILVALCSAYTERVPVKNTAYTGEITLSGEILPVGGLNAKLIAAIRAGINTVAIPYQNKPEIEELPEKLTSSLEIIHTKTASEVLKLAFPV